MNHHPDWDLATIPFELLKAEWARRARAKRQYKLKCDCGKCATCKARQAVKKYRAKIKNPAEAGSGFRG